MKLYTFGLLLLVFVLIAGFSYGQKQTNCNTSSIPQYNRLCADTDSCVNLTYTAQLKECLNIDGTCEEGTRNSTKKFCMNNNTDSCFQLPVLDEITRCIDVNIAKNCTIEDTLKHFQFCSGASFPPMCVNLTYMVETKFCFHRHCVASEKNSTRRFCFDNGKFCFEIPILDEVVVCVAGGDSVRHSEISSSSSAITSNLYAKTSKKIQFSFHAYRVSIS